jgi:uncharacterized protein YjdB
LVDTPAGGVWTSSNPPVATIGATGMVTAMSPGATVITYAVTFPFGVVTATVSVLVQDSVHAITGPDSVCVSGTATLLNASAGGTWSSSNTAIATVAGSGTVTGIAPGTTIVTYELTNACGTTTATKNITVLGPADCAACELAGEVTNGSEVFVFPNPAHESIQIKVQEPAKVTLLNVTGQAVAQQDHGGQMNIASLPSGLYFLIIRDVNDAVIKRVKIAKE